MPRRAKIHYVSIHSSLVNLPISLYGPLLKRGVESIVVALASCLMCKPLIGVSLIVLKNHICDCSDLKD